jgi:acetyl-CoA carboxylase carboxyl transferase subunit beta
MSILEWFGKKEQLNKGNDKLNIPGDLWVKCFSCKEILYLKDLEDNLKVCTKCGHHFRISARERIHYVSDKDSFNELFTNVRSKDFLGFHDTESYTKRLEKANKKNPDNSDAVIVGEAKLMKKPINLGVMDFSFMGGSMGSVVGEKITRLIENALKNKAPVIIFSSSGGARMQEGILSLMQMAKTSAALAKLSAENIPYISVLCDPTTGGTSASFSMLGDIHIAEPGALISFAGPRVIEQTIRQKLPKGFQRSEFLLEHGMVDMVINRKELKQTLAQIIGILQVG